MSIRRAVLPMLALSVIATAPAGATATKTPTMSTASTVAGQPINRPLADGSWQYANGVWTATVRSASAPDGTTVVRASWTSPVVVGKPHQLWFATSLSVTHEGQSASSSRFFEQERVCYPHGGCEKWLSDQSDALPQQFDPSTLPFTVSFGGGVSLGWGAHPRPAYVQWEYVQTESGLDEQTNTIKIAVGPQAHTVQSS